MSNWIKVTNLPYCYDEKEAVDMFGEIGPIKRVEIERIQPLLKSNVLIQFANARNARLASMKKDQEIFGGDVIRVRVVWSHKETLTTVKVSNLPSGITDCELRDYFSPYGDIMDVRFVKTSFSLMETSVTFDDKMDEPANNEMVACISFARVDYALRACHEMHRSIISGSSDDSGLCVNLVNPDSRNLKWKRNLFEYVRCAVPSKRTKNSRHHRNLNSQPNGTRFSPAKGYSPASVSDKNSANVATNASANTKLNMSSNSKTSGVYGQLLNVPQNMPNTPVNITGSMMNWLPSMYPSTGIHANTESLKPSDLSSSSGDASKSNVGSVPYSVTFQDINSFNNVNANYINVADIIPKLKITDLLLPPNISLQSPGTFGQYNNSTPNSLSSSSVKSESTSSSFLFTGTAGMSSPFAPLLLPNMIMTIPQNGGFVSPVSSCSSGGRTPLLSYGFSTPRLVNNCSNTSSNFSLQQTPVQKVVNPNNNIVNINTDATNVLPRNLLQTSLPSNGNLNSIGTNPIQTPNVSLSGLTSTSNPANGTSVNNRHLDSPSLTSLATFSDIDTATKTTMTDLSSITSPQKTLSGSVCSASNDVSSSPSFWSPKQREIGDILYHELKLEYPERVAKLTGMLLSLPKSELNVLIYDKCKLKTRVNQFVQLLDRNEPSI